LAKSTGNAMVWTPVGPAADTPDLVTRTTFIVNSGGFLELATPVNGDVAVYIDLANLSSTGRSARLRIDDAATVDAGAPNFVRVRACVDFASGFVLIETPGRTNVLNCTGDAYLSSGTGTEIAICDNLAGGA
jgi:hypothetical protein